MKPIRFRVIENVYRKHLTVIVDPDVERARKAIVKLCGTEDVCEGMEDCAARTIMNPRRDVIVWLSNRNDIPALVHELGHVVFWVLGRAGIELSRDNDEPFTYLIEYYMTRCLQELGLGRLAGV